MSGSHAVRKSAGAATATALFLGALLYLTLCMDQSVGAYDEGITLVGAERVLRGDVPHRDFYALYGPGQFYVIAGLFKLFGASVLVERVCITVMSACSTALIFLIVDRVAPRYLAVLAAIAALPWFRNSGPYGSATIPCMTAMLTGLFLLAPVLSQAGGRPRLLGAGMCAGVAMLFRYDAGVAIFGSECVLLAVAIWFEHPIVADRPRAIALGLIVFGAGFAAITVPVAVAYAINGTLSDFYFDVVTFPSAAYVRTRGLPLPRLWMLRKDPAEFFGVYLPLVVCAATVPALIASIVARQSALRWTVLALAVLELVWFAKGFVRASLPQMGMAVVLCAPLAAMLAQPIRGRGPIGAAMAVMAIVLGLGVTVASEPPALAAAWRNLSQAPDCHLPADLERMACFLVRADTAEAIRYIHQHTAPDDPIFIGLPRHDKIFVNDVTLYFQMDRPVATKWHQFDPGLQTSLPIQREMIGELQRVRPRFVVITSIWNGMNEPNDSSVSSGVTLLDDYIRQTYESVATFGPNTILRARTL
jgi:hypothetical protein